MNLSPSLVIPIAGILMPLVLVPIAMTMRLRMRKREWEHLERMKSLELGVPAPLASNPGGVAAIGAGVPIVAFGTAFLTSLLVPVADHPNGVLAAGGPFQFHSTAYSVPDSAIVWGCAAVVSLFAMLTATILGVVQARAHSRALQSSRWAGAHSKPVFDPESYEFAGNRS